MSVAGIVHTSQYLTFRLDEEIFALDISQVREVLDYTTITRVPRTPDFMCGVINLRGSVVPVVDMRLKFGMPKTEQTINTCIIIVEIKTGEEDVLIGALADSVQEVLELEPESIEPAPRIGTGLKVDFIKGMGKGTSPSGTGSRDEKFLIILDVDRVFSEEELSSMGKNDAGPRPSGTGALAGELDRSEGRAEAGGASAGK
ncbi:MAG: chemotaxis protein CheW [Nitrospiraceae bacterium]|nr:chemotaxis protein CheW [Nitrospiraceae bacterium]